MIRTILTTVILTALALHVHGQTTHFVPSPATPSIQSAINAAASGDLIQVSAGSYVENLLIAGKDLTIQGAGMHSTSILAGPGVGLMISSGAGGKTVLKDLAIVGGTPAGIAGGVNVDLDLLGVRVQGSIGFGVDFRLARNLLIEDSEIVGVTGGSNFGGGIKTAAGDLTLRRTLFAMNDFSGTFVLAFADVVQKVVDALTLGGDVLIEDCEFRENKSTFTCLFLETDGEVRITGSRMVDNVVGSEMLLMFGDLGNFLEDTLIAANTTTSVRLVTVRNSSTIERVTIAHNVTSSLPNAAAIGFIAVAQASRMSSTIVSGNTANVVSVGTDLTIERCLLESGVFAESLNGVILASVFRIDVLDGLAAGFRDPAQGDFSLLPGSAAVDQGIASPGTPLNDLDGNPRVFGSGIDMGCFELQNQDPGPSHAGTTSTADLLTCNGTSGGVTRSLTIDVGSIATIAVDTPIPGTTSPFIIWGYLGVPGDAESFPIPFAGGSMAFLPQLVDIGNPLRFTFANNLLAPTSGLLFSTPAPWSVTGPSVPFPISMTLQGLIVDGGGPLRITNAITLHTR